jgi:hypothetical protein
MNKTILGKLLLSTIGLVGIAGPLSAAPVFTLGLFNIDDTMRATITNSAFTSTEFLSVTTPNTALFDFSSFVRAGSNTVHLALENTHGGWTYGYEFKINGVVADAGSCGTFSVVGCKNNDSTVGLAVFTHDFSFQGDGSTTVGAPEPSALLLTAFGLFPIAAFLRKKARV